MNQSRALLFDQAQILTQQSGATPYTYLVEPLVALVTHDLPVRCDAQELANFTAPPGQSCNAYADPYVAAVGSGYVQTNADGSCAYCRFKNGDEFVSIFFYSLSLCAYLAV